MFRRVARQTAILALSLATVLPGSLAAAGPRPAAGPSAPGPSAPDGRGAPGAETVATPGALQIIDAGGNPSATCPLKHTDVKAEVSGFLSRVRVTQEFGNPSDEKIEAVYTFPLPQNAAVDDMVMQVGTRTVRGVIKRREEAQAAYEAARASGHVASLLDQERPNIFTQSVANIMPGERVLITISYVETLAYDGGTYSFVFPMVVGPRYIPGDAVGKQGGGFAPDTDRVPDASRITPQVAAKGTRAGHDISLEVAVDAGVPIEAIRSTTHEVDVDRRDGHSAVVRLHDAATIPNKDFVLTYDVAGHKVQDAVITHKGRRGGFFTMILQPPDRVTAEDVTPKELVFVLDTSGSMEGFPIDKAKETMKLALDGMYPEDTFNIITFAGDTHILFPKCVPASAQNVRKAQSFLESSRGEGGTEMMTAIRAALDPSDRSDHIRIVVFFTDGYVGNDMEIIGEVQKHQNARVFSFGVGSSVNRFLLDKMAEEGRGEVEYVGLQDDGSAAAHRLYERVRSPLLTDISVDWAGMPGVDVYPKRVPDLFSAKPVVISGRFEQGWRGTIKLHGKMSGHEVVREIPVVLPENEERHDVLATLWARRKIDDLMSQDYDGNQRGTPREGLKEEITKVGLDYRLMTQYTSFVAVEEMVVTDNGQPRRVDVPVELPDGVSRDGVFGAEDEERAAPMASSGMGSLGRVQSQPSKPMYKPKTSGRRTGGGGMAGTKEVLAEPKKDPSPVSVDKPESPADAKVREKAGEEQEMLSKLHPAVAAIVTRLEAKSAQPGAAEASFVRDGKAEVQVWLTTKSEKVLAELRALGFEIVLDPKSSNLVIGRIPIEKLAALSRLLSVRYVAPQTN